MKRIHVALKVGSLRKSIEFYTALFGTDPTVAKDDYAKWLIDDPRVNFSITERSGESGIEHLGIQAENESELQQLYANVTEANTAVRAEGHTTCCYANSEKSWAKDPQGVEWEMFYTYGESDTFYGTESDACCESSCCSDAVAA